MAVIPAIINYGTGHGHGAAPIDLILPTSIGCDADCLLIPAGIIRHLGELAHWFQTQTAAKDAKVYKVGVDLPSSHVEFPSNTTPYVIMFGHDEGGHTNKIHSTLDGHLGLFFSL